MFINRLVLKYDPNQPRDENGRWGGGGGEAPRGNISEVEAEGLALLVQRRGGFTYQPIDDTSPKSGFAVSTFQDAEHVIKDGSRTIEDISADVYGYLQKHKERFQDPKVYAGGWYDKEAEKIYLDLSTVEDSRETAVALAKQHNQEAVFDLGGMETVMVKEEHERRKASTDKIQAFMVRPRNTGKWGLEEAALAMATAVENSKGEKNYNPSQPRDENGRWSAAGVSGLLSERMAYRGKLSKPKTAKMKAAFDKVAGEITQNMGPAALEAIGKNLNEVRTYGGPVAIVNDLRAYGVTGKAAGYYNRATRDMGVVMQESEGFGKEKTGRGEWKLSDRVLAHELGHVIDGPSHSFSSTKEWQEIFNTEVKNHPKLDDMTKRTKSEAFADLVKEFIAPATTEFSFDTMDHVPIPPPAERFPQAHKFLKERGLIL